MQSLRTYVVWAALLVPAALFGQTVTTSGSVSFSAGAALQDGNRASYQKVTQHRKDGFGGLDEFRLTREGKDDVFTFDARLLPLDEDYRLAVRYDKTDHYYVDAGFEQFRIWSDTEGGYFGPTNTRFTLFDNDLALDRSKLWLEVGAFTANKTYLKLRYQRTTREGTKDSTFWGDTNLVGAPYGTRNIVPAFYDLDEATTTISFDVGNESLENQKWNLGTSYSKTSLDDKHFSARRPLESVSRTITHKDETSNDLWATHGFYERKLSEQLLISAGALITKLDTNIEGSRIYGQTYDPAFDPVAVRRQQRDEGFYNLEGDANLKQTVLNLNAVYTPRKNWSIRPSVRYENLHQEAVAEFVETNVGAGPGFVTALEDLESDSSKKWDEFTEAIDVRYTGKPNWTFSGAAEWIQGSGTLNEAEKEAETGAVSVNRLDDDHRKAQKYSLSANWYAKPGLTFAAQYYYKLRLNDYDPVVDSTPPYGGDRYPAYIIDQDFETNDVNFRISWRPVSMLNLVTRYDFQGSTINTVQAGLGATQSAKLTSHILSESVTWSPTARLYLSGSVNVTYDQMKTPAIAFVQNGDNNSVNATLGGGYVLTQKDDIYVDYSLYRANNFADNSRIGVPYGADQRTQATYVTWKRRHTESLIYTLKYGYVTNRDNLWGGRNDFDAHVIYAKVQYMF